MSRPKTPVTVLTGFLGAGSLTTDLVAAKRRHLDPIGLWAQSRQRGSKHRL